MTTTRLDMTYAAFQVSQFMYSPGICIFMFWVHFVLNCVLLMYLLQLDELKSCDFMQVPFQPDGTGSRPLSIKLAASGHTPEFRFCTYGLYYKSMMIQIK